MSVAFRFASRILIGGRQESNGVRVIKVLPQIDQRGRGEHGLPTYGTVPMLYASLLRHNEGGSKIS
jgi:hypothetical protein